MGTTDSAPSSTLSHFSRRFVVTPDAQDQQQGTLFHLHEKLTNNKFILRIVSTDDDDQRQRIEAMICKKLAMKKLYESKPMAVMGIDHYIIEQDRGYYSTLHKCYLLFDARNAQPLTHFLVRGAFHGTIAKVFTEDTLHRGLLNLVEGVALLKYYKDPHRNINCSTVYYQHEQNTLLLTDPWLVTAAQTSDQYHAPQKLRQLESYDLYVADLFSIGMVGLRLLGYSNLSQLYLPNKTIDMARISKIVSGINSAKLRELLEGLLSEDVAEREQILNKLKLQHFNLTSSKQEHLLAKTRNLQGKVSSVRKSFFNNHNSPVVRSNVKDPRDFQPMINTQLLNLNSKAERQNSNEAQNFKKKAFSTQPYQPVYPSLQTSTYASNLNQNTLKVQFNPPAMPSENPQLCRQPAPYVISKPNNQFVMSLKPAASTYFTQTPSATHIQTNQMHNYFKSVNSGSFKSLNNYNEATTKILTNVNSTPNTFSSSQLNLGPSKSQIFGPQTQDIKKSEIYQEERGQNKATISDLIISKDQNIEIYKANHLRTPTSHIDPNLVPEKKQQSHPLKTCPSYRSSDSFESDHAYHNKIQENLKALENKISEAINSSRLNVTDSRVESVYHDGANLLDNSQNRMIESLIVPRDQEASSHSTVNALNEQIKTVEDQKQARLGLKDEQKLPLTDRVDHSPILVKQVQNKHLLAVAEENKKASQSDNSPESQDFLNINSAKTSQQEEVEKTVPMIEQKFEQPLQTPSKAVNPTHLEANNLTIPEQSDEQSENQERIRIEGDYVEQVYENGGKYIGYMLNGQRNGHGIFYYRDGGYYDGRWKNNMMNGYGKLYYETGNLAYEGQWYQDEFHGRGTVYNNAPEPVAEQGFDYRNMNQAENCWHYYQGDLRHDMKSRYGKLVLSNNEYYEGEFRNDEVDGKGQFYRHDGTVVRGIWAEGILVKQL